MTTTSLSSAANPQTPGRQNNRRRAAGVGLALIAVAAMAAGWWWNFQRPENSFRRGRRALLARDGRTVARESRRLLRTSGYEPQGYLLAGLWLLQDGHPAEALHQLQHAALAPATALEAFTAAAESYYRLGHYVESIKAARSALAADEGALDARRWLAAAYYDLGATALAAEELKRISQAASGDSRPERLLGLICKDNERFEEAIEHYCESLRREPQPADQTEVVLELVTSLVKLSRFREALDALRDCDPAPALLALAGECEQSLGRTDVALLRFGEALELDPQCVPGRLQRGTLFLTEGRLDEAAADFEAALKRAPHDSRIHYQLLQTYTRLGRGDEAALHLRLMQENQVVEVEFADLNRLAARNADDAELRFRIGSLALRLDKPELARMWFRSVLALDSNHAQARAALAAAEEPTVGQ